MAKDLSHREHKSADFRRRTTRGTAVLQQLLTELALVLLPRGMTPKRFCELARAAFVNAAADMSRLRNGRVNQSRIAAQTGLTRAEVKRVLEGNAFDSTRLGGTALERVIGAWRTDHEFVTKFGHPKRLPIVGSKSSFVRLVRKYGGDIPHRAVLDELRRIGAVSDDTGRIRLLTSRLRRRRDLVFLSPVLPALIDGLRIAAKGSSSAEFPAVHRLSLPVESEVDLAIVRDRCVSSARALVEGLGHSLGTQVTVPRRGRAPAYAFTVTILLTEDRSQGLQRTRQSRK